MRYFLSLLLVFSGLAWADTVQQRVTALANAPGVLGVSSAAEPEPLFAGLGRVRVTYATADSDTAAVNTADLLVVSWGTGSEAAYWLPRVPAPLVTEPVVEYLSDRTASTVTAEQIQTFCNSAWRDAAGGAQTGAGDIRQFAVVPVDGRSVQVGGWFHLVGDNTWERRTYLVRLIDPDGALTLASGNIKFERVTAE